MNSKNNMEFEQILEKHRLEVQDIAKMFGYKNANSFQSSSAKPRIKKGITEFYNIVKK